MYIGRAVAVDGGLGSQPSLISALTNTLVPVAGVKPQSTMRTPREIYTAVAGNNAAAVSYLQVIAPTVSGNVPALGAAGAKTGVIVTLPPDSAPIVNGNSYFIDVAPNSELVTVTVTAGPTNNPDGSTSTTVSFTTTLTHSAVLVSLMGGVTLGTTVPKQSYPVQVATTLPLLFGDMGQQYPLGFLVAATTTPTGAAAPSAAMVANFGIG